MFVSKVVGDWKFQKIDKQSLFESYKEFFLRKKWISSAEKQFKSTLISKQLKQGKINLGSLDRAEVYHLWKKRLDLSLQVKLVGSPGSDHIALHGYLM